jgi:hypothetical protein
MVGRWRGFHPRALALVTVVWLIPVAAPAGADEPLVVVVDGVLDASPADVRRVLLDLDEFAEWFPWLAEWRVLSKTDSGAQVYGRQDVPWPGRDRDYVAQYRWWSEEEVFFLEAVGTPDAVPPAPRGVDRVEQFRSEWRIEPDESGGTRARYTAEGPLAGPVRRLLDRYAWRRHSRRVLDGLEAQLKDPGRTD